MLMRYQIRGGVSIPPNCEPSRDPFPANLSHETSPFEEEEEKDNFFLWQQMILGPHVAQIFHPFCIFSSFFFFLKKIQ